MPKQEEAGIVAMNANSGGSGDRNRTRTKAERATGGSRREGIGGTLCVLGVSSDSLAFHGYVSEERKKYTKCHFLMIYTNMQCALPA